MKWVSFSLFLDAHPPPPPPQTQNMSLPKGHLGSGGASKNKLKDTIFIFPMTNVTLLGIFCAHAQKDYGKVWEMKIIPILNIIALLLFYLRRFSESTSSSGSTPSVRPSVCLSVRSSVRPFVCPQLFWGA